MIRRTIKGSAIQLSTQGRARRVLRYMSKEASSSTQREYRTHADKAAVVNAIADVLGTFQ
jgi:hypothetical protein